MMYRFIVKQSIAKTAKIIFRSAWTEFDTWEEAVNWRDDYIKESVYRNYPTRLESKKGTGRGGPRPGAGTKSPQKNGAYKGMGSKYGESTKVVRVPTSRFHQVDTCIEALDTIDGILQAWQSQIEVATQDSVTGKTPRTYDKAMQLIQELREEFKTELPF